VGVLDSIHNFRSLSLVDLLDAREHYHLHLLNKKNVVATGVGLYLIRNDDPWPNRKDPAHGLSTKSSVERTLTNSSTRPYSWPCVLVFVDNWVDKKDVGVHIDPSDFVPKTLFLSDGRTVPVCVVLVTPAHPAQSSPAVRRWPETLIGGGFPLYSSSQGIARYGTVGGLVTDSRTVFALSARHVCGKPNDVVQACLRGEMERIGVASDKSLGKVPFNRLFPYLPQTSANTTVDIGLIEVDNASDWTSQQFGLERIAEIADINQMNLGTQLIDQKVRGFGSVTGLISGTIKALFYRYRTSAGVDDVTDLLIAPDNQRSQSAPGDSGALWYLEVNSLEDNSGHGKQTSLHPLAIQWGGQGLALDGKPTNFALATLLSPVLSALGVELVQEHNTGARPFWGAVGHYSIARLAVDSLKTGKLKTLMKANATRVSFDLDDLINGQSSLNLDAGAFVPLADVPDVVWKKPATTVEGGRNRGSQKPENPTHYADVDQPGVNGSASLLKQFQQDPASLSIANWQAFYDSVGSTKQNQRGLLPFRVWQLFDAMKQFVKDEDLARFVAAAGILAHYIGDACQPLHSSMLADGYEDGSGAGIHSAYETKMIDDHASDLFAGIADLTSTSVVLPPVKNGFDSAVATMTVMAEAQKLIAPGKLCDAYIALGGGKSRATIDGLWGKFGRKTSQTMYNGQGLLAHVWEAAWREGGGNAIASSALIAVTEQRLQKLYRSPEFLTSLDLDQIGDILL
jgi:hypothetical protein